MADELALAPKGGWDLLGPASPAAAPRGQNRQRPVRVRERPRRGHPLLLHHPERHVSRPSLSPSFPPSLSPLLPSAHEPCVCAYAHTGPTPPSSRTSHSTGSHAPRARSSRACSSSTPPTPPRARRSARATTTSSRRSSSAWPRSRATSSSSRPGGSSRGRGRGRGRRGRLCIRSVSALKLRVQSPAGTSADADDCER